MEQWFSTEQVVALTGMTPRQLQWWDERGIVRPAREGRRRVYSFEDLAEVSVIATLRKRGFSLQRVRKVMGYLHREFGRRLAQTVMAGSDYHLLTNGENIYLETSPQQVVDIMKNARQPMFAVCLSDTVRQVSADVQGAGSKAALPQRGQANKNAPGRKVRESRISGRNTPAA